jgi:redox-sensitive bicupin YhaK (pirin superfamily)
MATQVQTVRRARPVAYRSFGERHGAITRLVSPHHFGEQIKPFVFLDLFESKGGAFEGFGLHPHSGIATLTYVAEGSVSYEDTNGARGSVDAGGVEWMRAGRGVWHGGGGGERGLTRGFQLWLALPPHLELGSSASLYQSARDVPVVGPARVLLGRYKGATSAIEAPADINYLAVRLGPGERWQYRPPASHQVFWIAVGKGKVRVPERIRHGAVAIFAPGNEPVEFVAETETEFVLGSAASHPHDLVTGRYSVHTSEGALAQGERRIRELHQELLKTGGL